MIDWIEKDTDEEIVRNFIESPFPGKKWFLWKNVYENPIEPDIEKELQQKFPGVPRMAVAISLLHLFERNDLSRTSRGDITLSSVSLPALELRFRDPDNPNAYIIGFIEGEKNINNFLRMFIQKYDEKYGYKNIGKRLVFFEYQLSEGVALTNDEKGELRKLLLSLAGIEDEEVKDLYSRLRTVHNRDLIVGNTTHLERLENEYEDLCIEYLSPETTQEKREIIRARQKELDDLFDEIGR